MNVSTNRSKFLMSPYVNHVTGVEVSYLTFALIFLCFRLFSLKDVTGGKPGHKMICFAQTLVEARAHGLNGGAVHTGLSCRTCDHK